MSIHQTIKKISQRLQRKKSGERFYHGHRLVNRLIRNYTWIKVALFFAGVFLFLLGFVMLFTPGPGLLLIFLGLLCFSLFSQRLARWFDVLENKVRAWRKKDRLQ